MHCAVAPRRLAVGKVVLAPLVAGYRLGLVAGTTVRSCVVGLGFRGASQARVEQAGHEFSRDILPGMLRPIALERIAWHKAQGDVVVVVSGALDVYLSPWCSQHGVELICSALETRDGTLTGRYRGEQCVGQEKSRRVLAQYAVGDFPVVYAYGDTHEDHDLLRIADRRYFRWQELC